MNKPPYTITEKAADYLIKIAESTIRLERETDFGRDIKLHRKNRVRTIHYSLAIEGNSLTLDEVSAVIEGKMIAGKQAEVKEVKNAYDAYDAVMTLRPYAVADFLKAHKLMTQGLVKEVGCFRCGDAGVFDGDMTVHIGARPQFVPQLIADLFAWAKAADTHPILKSAIMHYEIEIIHPFADGNGRMGRLWQTLLLARWNAISAWIPKESVLYQNRPQYYAAIAEAKKANDSAPFIEFTLSAIHRMLTEQGKPQTRHRVEHQVKHQVEHQVDWTDAQIEVLKVLENQTLSRKEIFPAIGISGDSRAFKRHMEPLLTAGFIEMTVPDKPSSRLQKYRWTGRNERNCKKPR